MSRDLFDTLAALDPQEPLLVALDFDGTLSHLVAEPGLARPAPGVIEWLEQLSRDPLTDVVLVSGRALHDLARVSGAEEVATLIGSHGQEHGAAAPLDTDEAATLDSLRGAVAGDVGTVPGVRVEDKPAGIAVHVRACTRDDAAAVVARVRQLAARVSTVHLIEGKEVVEVSVRPLDKGSALQALMAQEPQRRVIFAGDDVTDEAAMAVLRPQDISIKVGPGDSIARYRVDDPVAMVGVLAALAGVRGGGG